MTYRRRVAGGLMKLGRYTVAGYAVAVGLGIGLILTYGAMEASSTPAFCGSCHVMEPYYESWKASSHTDIACVDCHIPPGITAELRKKYEALSMVARYFTGTYGTNPWTEVDDAACLECHERRLLAGASSFGDVLFDHGPHLTELRRGKRLRCTSCHSQIVQGSHITVTATTCILCHFKDQEPGTGTARCALCHQTPTQIVDAEGSGVRPRRRGPLRHGLRVLSHARRRRAPAGCRASGASPATTSPSDWRAYDDAESSIRTTSPTTRSSAPTAISRSSTSRRAIWRRRKPTATPATAAATLRSAISTPVSAARACRPCPT